jgi:hypothetical protein
MSDLTSQSSRPSSPDAGPSLSDRVRQRVIAVSETLLQQDRQRTTAPLRRAPRGRADAAPLLSSGGPGARELRALRLVFHELGALYRGHRQRTGEPVPAPLRSAARAFRQEPSLISLVPVAGFIDDLKLLEW